jgi:hypothetical protein
LPADGPWKASQAHFAGWEKTKCPASFQEKTGSQDIENLGNVLLKLETNDSGKTRLDRVALRSKLWCIPKHENVRALVAILPDPVQTNMQVQFDRMIDGLQLAAESSGYVIDRYWLPWEVPSTNEYADYASRKAVLQDREEKQRQPGLLLFRWNGTRSSVKSATLFVFLVSDTSTAGVNGVQFSNAVNYIRDICADSQRNCRRAPITIIGPTFSGSLASLRHLTVIQSQEFYAYSGTISSVCAARNQDLQWKSEVKAQKLDCTSAEERAAEQQGEGKKAVLSRSGLHAGPQRNNLHFVPLMHDTESALALLIGWLEAIKEMKPEDHQCDLAIFSEVGTTYGGVATQQLGSGTTKQDQHPATDNPCYLGFAYPREISSLRNAYLGQEPTASNGDAGRNTGFTYLPFSLADRESNRSDEPPDFSRPQGPLSREAVLMSFAAELRRQHIKYAGIIGSNVLDVLFLASFLRKACPDIRLFVVNADLLFERDLDNSPYIGMLTLTTYPLIIRNLDWVQDSQEPKMQRFPPRRLPFVDQYQEGEYNAALYAISEPLQKSSHDEAAPPDSRELVYPFEASSKPDKSNLPLLLTAVGYGGYWPVMLLRPESGGSTADPRLRDEDFSPAWKAAAAMACVFALLHILGLMTNFRPRIRVAVFLLFGPDIHRRFLFINMASATLVTSLGMLLVPILKFPKIGVGLQVMTGLMAAMATAIVALCVGLAIYQWLPSSFRELSRRTLKRTLGFGSCTVAVWLLAWLGVFSWWKLHTDDASHYGFFFAYRSVHLATGVSPFTPMIPLLAGFYCWALFESWRLKFHDEVRPRLRPSNALRTMDLPGGSTEDTVAKSVNDFRLRWKYLFAFLLVFILWCLSLPFVHPFQIFEPERYGYLYEVLFCLLVFLMLSSGFRLGQIWSDLKKLLAELDQSRIRPALDRIREHSWSPIWHSGVTERAWTNIDRCVERMEQIVCSEPKPLQDVVSTVEQLAQSVNVEMQGNNELRSEKQPSPEIQQTLQQLVQQAMTNLEEYWKGNGACAADEPHDDEEKQIVVYSKPKKVDAYTGQMKRLEEFVALRYMAFIGGVLYQIRMLIIIVAMLFTLILLSLNIYSFEPHQSLIWSFTAMFAVIGFLIVNVLREVHRDNVLSRVTGTKANKLGLDFYVRIALFGAAPVVTLLATHFPAISRYLVSFVQPGLEAVK